MPTLQVYVSDHCRGCKRAREMAREVSRLFPQLLVEVVNLDVAPPPQPAHVFAVPTYVLNGKTVFLGNPRREQLLSILSALAKR